MTTSVAAVLADAAARRPDHPALICGTERVTYAALWAQSRRYAAVLSRRGVRPGLPVAILVPDDLDFPRAYFAALTAGAVAFPLNPTSSVAEIGNVLSDAGVRFLICADHLRDQAEEAAGPHGTTIIPASAADAPEPLDGFVPRSPDELAVVFYTSGTTGTPKGVMLSHRNILSNVHGMREIPYAFRDDDVLLGGLPLAYSFGQICGLLTAVHAGITMVLMPRFTGSEALRLAAQHHCTVFMGVPTMYLKMLEALADGGPAPGFDRVYSGGSALPVTTFHDIRRVFGCPVYEGYGATETATSLAYNHPAVPCRPGTVGVPIDGVTIGIVEPNATGIALLPAGATGEIVARGDNVMAGYLGRPDLTAEVITDGWFRTGDLGRLDDAGYLRVVGRKKELILRGGHNVHPREVEEVLTAHPAVEQAAVIGLPHPVLGEEVCAVIVPAPAHDATPALADDIVAWSKARLSAHKYPRRVQFVSVFPTGPGGKVLKRELLPLFASAPDMRPSPHPALPGLP